MKWAKLLKIESAETVEKRLADILLKMHKQSGEATCSIHDIDATGKIGSALTKRINEGEEIECNLSELINVLEEEGQVFELDGSVCIEGVYRFIITDGQYIDVVGDNNGIIAFLGACDELDPDSF